MLVLGKAVAGVRLKRGDIMLEKLVPFGMACMALMSAGCSRSRVGEEAASVNPAQERGTGRAQTESRARPALVLPEGTPIRVRLVSTLSTATHKAGEPFDATLVEPLVVGTRTIASKGAAVTGKVVESDPGGRIKDVAIIAVQLTGLRTEGGGQVEISTGSVARKAGTTKGRDAQKVGIGAGIGAAVGAIAGGGKGAAIGAAAGAGAGTGTVLATRGKPAVLRSETVLKFELRYPVTLVD